MHRLLKREHLDLKITPYQVRARGASVSGGCDCSCRLVLCVPMQDAMSAAEHQLPAAALHVRRCWRPPAPTASSSLCHRRYVWLLCRWGVWLQQGSSCGVLHTAHLMQRHSAPCPATHSLLVVECCICFTHLHSPCSRWRVCWLRTARSTASWPCTTQTPQVSSEVARCGWAGWSIDGHHMHVALAPARPRLNVSLMIHTPS